jgi:hypothetical protein
MNLIASTSGLANSNAISRGSRRSWFHCRSAFHAATRFAVSEAPTTPVAKQEVPAAEPSGFIALLFSQQCMPAETSFMLLADWETSRSAYLHPPGMQYKYFFA